MVKDEYSLQVKLLVSLIQWEKAFLLVLKADTA